MRKILEKLSEIYVNWRIRREFKRLFRSYRWDRWDLDKGEINYYNIIGDLWNVSEAFVKFDINKEPWV